MGPSRSLELGCCTVSGHLDQAGPLVMGPGLDLVGCSKGIDREIGEEEGGQLTELGPT